VTATLRNQGDIGAPASQARIYLAHGTTRARTDTPLSPLMSVGPLAAGQNASATATVTIPTTQPVGAYFLIVCSDDRGGVLESNEANNCAAASTIVSITSAGIRFRVIRPM
jgi:subtilase family serine protease